MPMQGAASRGPDRLLPPETARQLREREPPESVMEPIAKGLAPELRADIAQYYAGIDASFDKGKQTRRAPERGRVLAMEGDNARGVQACRNCHGPGGVANRRAFPILPVSMQIIFQPLSMNVKKGTRTNDAGLQMFTVARALSRDDIFAVAQPMQRCRRQSLRRWQSCKRRQRRKNRRAPAHRARRGESRAEGKRWASSNRRL